MITSTFVPDSIHAGDCGPFGESLYNTISKNISRLAGKFYSILTIEDVQDLTHDTYLRLLESKSNADMSKNFAGYVYRTCKNQVNTYALNKSKRNGWLYSYDEDYCDDETCNDCEDSAIFTDDTYMADIPVMRKEFNQKLWRVISKLNPTDRSIAVMLMDEVPYKEMAQELGCTENAVKTKVFRTREVLRKYGLVG